MKWFKRERQKPVYVEKEKQQEYEKVLIAEREKGNSNINAENRAVYAKFLENEPIREQYILYEAYGGRGMLCSPYTIFKYLLSQKEFKKYVHIWVIDDFEDNCLIMKQYAKYKNVRFIEYQSGEYRKYLASAKYLINNVSFPGYFTKREEQIYLNTWHGIPLKTVGLDIPEGNISSGNMVRNFLAADYLISPNDFMTDIYKTAFKLEGLYEGTILQEGQPRNDGYFSTERSAIIDTLQKNGVEVDPNKKIIMYAPTWKGEQYSNPDVGLETYFEIIKRIERSVDTEEYQVLVKPHQIVYKYIKNTQELTGQFIPAIIDTNEILSVVDILISDYSSIYFDYLVSEKPILFFIPDLEEYKEQRGLYFGMDKLPGPIAQSFDELEEFMKDVDKAMAPHWEKYRKEKAWACPADDGNVCKRLTDTVFREKNTGNSVKCDITSKKKILIYGGSMATNGITFSLLTLFKHFDYSKYDVTLIARATNDKVVRERLLTLEPKVRVLYRNATYNASYEEAAAHELIMKYGVDAGYEIPEKMYRRELRRSIGESHFDYAVEFSGYSSFNAVLFMHLQKTKKIIWLHSDLFKELSKGERGGADVGKFLKVCISVYPYYDKIVGCSKSIMEINRRNLSTDKTREKFTYARNLVNFARIFEEMDIETDISSEKADYYIADRIKNGTVVKLLEVLPVPQAECINFVTMGRLSPEKNHENLIKAVSVLYKKNPKIRLYILGEGPLRKDLEKLIAEEGMEGIVHLVGALKNPFSFLKQCDCFILSSHYEGQPVVVLEARALHMPCIISEFESVKDVLLENGQLLTGQSKEELQEAMFAFIDGKVPEYEFNYEHYNQEVYEEFEKIFTE